jgi:hypothetical protein
VCVCLCVCVENAGLRVCYELVGLMTVSVTNVVSSLRMFHAQLQGRHISSHGGLRH